MLFSIKMKTHRYFQLIGLYGALFLLPVMQHQINVFSGDEENAQREQVNEIVHDLYYMNKRMVCAVLGQSSTVQQCKEGIYQNKALSLAVHKEQAATYNKDNKLSQFWIFYIIFAAAGFIGNGIEYQREYENELKSNKTKKDTRETNLQKLAQLVRLYKCGNITKSEYRMSRLRVWLGK